VSKTRTRGRFSFRIRMRRSAQPLLRDARTKAGELSMPRKESSFWKASDMDRLPWSWRMDRLRAASFECPELAARAFGSAPALVVREIGP
jgi:hypothetical protein